MWFILNNIANKSLETVEDITEIIQNSEKDSYISESEDESSNEEEISEDSSKDFENNEEKEQETEEKTTLESIEDNQSVIIDKELDDGFFIADEMSKFADLIDKEEEEQLVLEKMFNKERFSNEAKYGTLGETNEESDEEDDEEVVLDEIFEDISVGSKEDLYFDDFFGDPERQKKRIAYVEKGRTETSDDPRNKSEDDLSVGDDNLAVENENEEESGDEIVEGLNDENSENGDSDEEVEDEENDKELSKYEKEQKKLQKKLRDLEKKNIKQKEWQLTGETISKQRPENALLEESKLDIDVNYVVNPPPIITETLTYDYEQLIKQRIANLDYDDVQKKLPKDDRILNELGELAKTKKIEMLEEELGKKSKAGLGEVYEKELVIQGKEEDRKTLEKKMELKDLFDNIMYKLNTLSSFSYVPKPIKNRELQKLVSNTEDHISSLATEEKVPVSMRERETKTPAELLKENSKPLNKSKAIGEVKSNNELTKEDRKKLRREKKKLKQKKRTREEAEMNVLKNLKPDLKNKYAKEKMKKKIRLMDEKQDRNSNVLEDEVKSYTNSTNFFKMMKETVANDISRRTKDKVKKKKSDKVRNYKL